jgi:hypothetical protein
MRKSGCQDDELRGVGTEKEFFTLWSGVWMLWPAVFVFIFRDASDDFVGAVLREHFLYPPSLSNVSTHWIGGESVYKSLYLSVWYVNTLLLAGRYAIYLVENPCYFVNSMERDSILKMLVLGISGVCISGGMYSGIVFGAATSLSLKEELLLTNDLGLLVGLPVIYSWVACALVGAAFCFLVAWKGRR